MAIVRGVSIRDSAYLAMVSHPELRMKMIHNRFISNEDYYEYMAKECNCANKYEMFDEAKICRNSIDRELRKGIEDFRATCTVCAYIGDEPLIK